MLLYIKLHCYKGVDKLLGVCQTLQSIYNGITLYKDERYITIQQEFPTFNTALRLFHTYRSSIDKLSNFYNYEFDVVKILIIDNDSVSSLAFAGKCMCVEVHEGVETRRKMCQIEHIFYEED